MTGVDKLEEGTKVGTQTPSAAPPVSPPVKSAATKRGKA